MANVETIVPEKVENKEAKFKRLANSRVNAALKKIQLIGNLSGSQYGKTQEQIDTIENALYAAIENMKTRFNKTSDDIQSFQL